MVSIEEDKVDEVTIRILNAELAEEMTLWLDLNRRIPLFGHLPP
jgi:hypothetical protein